MRDHLVFLTLALPALLLAVSLYCLDRVRRREALYRWALENGYRLRGFKQPLLTEMSPFPFAWSKSQQVFHVDVEDWLGNRRAGWVRLGSGWRGLRSRKAQVRWDKA